MDYGQRRASLSCASNELPMVDIELIFDAGSARDGKLHGLAHLVTDLLAYGAGGMNADQITTAFDSIGAQYHTDTGRDTTSVRLRTLTNQLQKSTELLATIVSAPDFPEQMLGQVKARTLTAIRKQAQEPIRLPPSHSIRHSTETIHTDILA